MTASPQLTVVSAAAGTGKTTRVVQEYLSLLRAGISPSRIVAITFTRKAAAELVETVSMCLRSSLGGNVPKKFLQDFAACYQGHLPEDQSFIRKALNELPNAPAGTTDSFVQRLLSEFALEARLPVEDGGLPAWLDLPMGQGDTAAVFEAAIRDMIEPSDGRVPNEAARLLEHLTLRELLARVSDTIPALPLRDLEQGLDIVMGADLAPRVLDMVAEAFRSALEDTPKLIDERPIGACENYHVPVWEWVQGGMQAPVPYELAPWCGGRTQATDNSSLAKALRAELARQRIDLGAAKVGLDSVVTHLGAGFSKKGIQTCDVIRIDLLSLAERARSHAFRMAAQSGALDYDLLTEAAIELCSRSDRSDRLRGRFDALLVDEVQDSSPRQFRLYQALEQLPGDGRRIRAFYVGDSRQSIYLFRGADPDGLARLEGRVDPEMLGTNYRSTPAMVEAQKALFVRAAAGVEDVMGLYGVAPVDHVQSTSVQKGQELSPDAPYPQPIVMVGLKPRLDKSKWSTWDFNAAAIDVFAERLSDAWIREGRPADTAAVLTKSWANAIAARDRLRTIFRAMGKGDAFLDGSRELVLGRVAQDVRMIVQALWDSTNDIAWAGLWRHPMIGMSDGALAAFKGGCGLLSGDAKPFGLSSVLAAEALSPEVFPATDIQAFDRARPVLQRARNNIGRIPTADVIEQLAAALQWRAILLAGPDGMDSLGELEVILDWIRQTETDRVDPDSVVALLDAQQAQEPPRVELHRGEQTVSCTTVHQAKGLKYHHVLVYDIGSSPDRSFDRTWSRASVRLGGRRCSLLGVKFDPNGALKPEADLLHVLSDQFHGVRRDEERLRLAYVAVTRAVRSVTFAVDPTADKSIHSKLSKLWTAEPPMPGICLKEVDTPRDVKAICQGYACAVGGFPIAPVKPSGWASVSPSNAEVAWKDRDPAAHGALVTNIAARCEFRPGGAPLFPPAVKGETAERGVNERDWGTLVHGWMEAGGLAPGADLALSVRFLSDCYGLTHPALAQWLVDLVRQLETTQPELVAVLRSPDATRYYEMPFVGVNETFPEEPWFHAGRMDLLVTWPGRRAWVIDFKAGASSPSSRDDLVSGAKLGEYAPQLDAYRRALTAAGWTVEKVGLLFMRTGAWVGW